MLPLKSSSKRRLNEEELLAVFEKSGVPGLPGRARIAERTEDHVR